MGGLKIAFNITVVILFIVLPIYIPILRHSLYIGLASGIVSIITLIMWPYFTFNMHRTPLYVEDIEKSNNPTLIWWFRLLLTVSTSVGLGIVVEFAWERFHNDDDIRLAEVLGVFGGLMTLFSKIHMITGNILLGVFGYISKRTRVDISTTTSNDDLSLVH